MPVRLEGVSFAYPDAEGVVLDSVDLELAPGETVALVGASGSGKSTIASLLLRLAEPTRRPRGGGSGRPRRRATRRPGGRSSPGCPSGRRCSAARWRRTSGSATAAAGDGRVRAAAALAGADAFVRELPDGYETVVGDGGRPLSAGQLQRIALARAFLRDAPLVILDEPTANLDPESAELVGEAVERLREGRTVLLVAHRPELARRADRIVTLAAGRIVEPALEAA